MTAPGIRTGLAPPAEVMVPLMITIGEFRLPAVTAPVAITVNVPPCPSVGIIMSVMASFAVLPLVLGLMTTLIPAGCMKTLMMPVLRLLPAMTIRIYSQGLMGVRDLLQGVNMLPMTAALSGRCVVHRLHWK